jgi:hypothetical protein
MGRSEFFVAGRPTFCKAVPRRNENECAARAKARTAMSKTNDLLNALVGNFLLRVLINLQATQLHALLHRFLIGLLELIHHGLEVATGRSATAVTAASDCTCRRIHDVTGSTEYSAHCSSPVVGVLDVFAVFVTPWSRFPVDGRRDVRQAAARRPQPEALCSERPLAVRVAPFERTFLHKRRPTLGILFFFQRLATHVHDVRERLHRHHPDGLLQFRLEGLRRFASSTATTVTFDRTADGSADHAADRAAENASRDLSNRSEYTHDDSPSLRSWRDRPRPTDELSMRFAFRHRPHDADVMSASFQEADERSIF